MPKRHCTAYGRQSKKQLSLKKNSSSYLMASYFLVVLFKKNIH